MKFCLGMLLAITGVLTAAFAAPVPGPGANQIFLFASGNTRESLSEEDAEARLTSPEQMNVTAVADRAACALTHSVRIGDSLGIYDKSSENSYIVEAELEQPKSKYLAALLGLYSHQEFVLLFLDKASGGDQLWIVTTPERLEDVIATLRKRKLVPVTVRREKDHQEIWFVDFGKKRARELEILTSEVNGRARIYPGIAETLGNQDRGTAFNGWRQRISVFERRNGPHLSDELSSKEWPRAAAVHTCSGEISIP